MSAWVVPVKFWKPGTTPLGIPVMRIARRSARSLVYFARFGKTPGYRTGSSPASSGLATYLANCLSSWGGVAFQASFLAIGVITSLNSGLPRRDTWLQAPCEVCLPFLSSQMRERWRLAVAHTPITDRGSIGSVGLSR